MVTVPDSIALVPVPSSLVRVDGPAFRFGPGLRLVTGDTPEEISLGVLAADLVGRRVGHPIDLVMGADGEGQVIAFALDPQAGPAGAEAAERYALTVTDVRIEITAPTPAGLLRGLTTLRQLGVRGADGVLEVPAVVIEDGPRYAWRGLSLDVVRHFLSVDLVKAVLSVMGDYKLNVLHLHLTDDQGWRIALPSRPLLTELSGQGEVGGGAGGFYTAEDYATLVAYAAARHITIVPEIDMPGHINAALHAYGELTPTGEATSAYTGIEVGFSQLDPDLPATARFLTDVFTDLAAMTPGEYLHIGGDEVFGLGAPEYAWFVRTAQDIAHAAGKKVVGWQEIVGAPLDPGAVVQYWDTRVATEPFVAAALAGATLLLSPGSKVYLDMKYDAATELGLEWAGHIELRDAYEWEPEDLIPGLPAGSILGVEAAVWTETITTGDDLFGMLLPRLAAVAEVAWSPADSRDWEGFRTRVAGQAALWDHAGLAWYRSPQVDW
ncbi:family 20 glycosylhydrolase [Pengzhenrongella frigida]|uniref:beta-N-acetylhexosaminidase n=1 Tax=Pengzhenrongella frigida TaxID=1259133 RepID=A0A4Q5MXL5_9MICO|nr:family 20 glycosylhydrolase [Cellulomonas sp. HLT2-17]RYV50380.1 beta-N-acetylhexosaminidase [Cellulomonas sp. HLT2-17]